MGLAISLTAVFIISFLLILKMVYSGNKEESEENKMNLFLVILVTFLLALLPTLAIAIILFVLIGSVSSIKLLFSLDISTSQLILLAISLFIYLFTLDNLVETFLRYLIGKKILNYVMLLLIRILVFYLIGLAIGLKETNSFTIAAGVAIIICLIEASQLARKKR